MDRKQLLADLNGYLRAYAEWNAPVSNLTYTFSLSEREDIGDLSDQSIRHFYADIAEVPTVSVNVDWKTAVVEVARRWMTQDWASSPTQLAGRGVATEWGRRTFEETLVARIESIVEPVQAVSAIYECLQGKKYGWYAASWDDLWLSNTRGERYLLHFSVTD